MEKQLKVATIVGTRPELIRLSRVLGSLERSTNHILIHTGQNYDYELNQVFFENLGIKKPNYFLESAKGSSSAANTIGNIISSVDDILRVELPDAVLILGDTNSCLSAIPAKRLQIPIFHMEAGNRCFDQRVPEEINRKIVDHIADINLTYSSIAREYLLREGFPADQIIKTGSPMYEVLSYYGESIKNSKILSELNLTSNKYFVVSVHREENIDYDLNLQKLMDLLNSLAGKYRIPIIMSTHPRTRAKIDASDIALNSLVQLRKPFGFFDYIKLQTNAKVVLSDSGTINEEASILGFPALNLREAHERPEGMEEVAAMMVGLNIERIMQAIRLLESEKQISEHKARIVADYSMPNVSEKVTKIIHSYVDYVNKIVWRKN